MSDYTRPSTWRPYRKNLCETCRGDCCRLPVEVHISEFPSMNLAHESELEDDLRILIKRLKKEKIIRLFDLKTNLATLEQKPNGACLFLGPNFLCTIYETRPKTCRDFPKVGPKSDFCPYNKKSY